MLVCVDTVLCFEDVLSIFSNESSKINHKFINNSLLNFNKFSTKKHNLLCFDCFNLLNFNRDCFFYDVKILYELQGYKFNNIISLLKEVFDESVIDKYCFLSEKIKAHIKSYNISKIEIVNFSMKDLFPFDLISEFYIERSLLIKKLYENIKDKDLIKFYEEYFYSVVKKIYDINQQYLELDLKKIKQLNNYHISFLNENKTKLYLKPVGAKTGRLSFKKGTLNLFNLPKKLRSCILAPKYFKIVQFDYKSFQPRIAIHITNNEEFKKKFRDIDDIYSKFSGDRETVKISFLAWMFSERIDDVFDVEAIAIRKHRKFLYEQLLKNGKILNDFGRVIYFHGEQENVFFQNFITSVEADMILSTLSILMKALENRKSKLLFPFHDAIIFKIHNDELFLIRKIKNFMEVHHEARFKTNFPIEVKVGKNFGEMREY
jgi:hypothetical protein